MLVSDYNLNDSDLRLLRKGHFHTVADILLTSNQDIAKRCKAFPLEIKRIVDTVLEAVPRRDLQHLGTSALTEDETFTTGDSLLDNALGGGIQTGMMWEVVGESSAGKTQFALQLSLCVQAPRNLGGLEASACYLTTSSKLPTARLLQISEAHKGLSSFCGLENVHTIAVPTVAILQRVITSVFPSFVEEQASKPGARPVKLLVIDALAELFHSANKTTTLTLVQRSKDIVSLSTTLHELANRHQIAVVVLNEVIDKFDRPNFNSSDQEDLLYEQQSRWFNTAEYFGDNAKEASLGLVWANQVNTRIMLSRTGRRRYLNHEDIAKRSRLATLSNSVAVPIRNVAQEECQSTLIRRLSVVFSNVSLPTSLDYIVTEKGISVLEDADLPTISSPGQIKEVPGQKNKTQLDTADKNLDMASMPTTTILNPSVTENLEEIDAFDEHLWSHAESYEDLDWDLLEQNLSQAHDFSTIR